MEKTVCEAVVLSLMDYGEADRIGAFFTLEHGKLRGIAKGARKSRRRFGGALELFARLRLELTVREGLSPLGGAEIVTIYPHIREELGRIAHAAYACELVDKMLPEWLPNPRLFRLLVAYLARLDEAPAEPSDRCFFEVNLLNILGYRPPLEHCADCGADLSAMPGRLTLAHGSLLCSACARAPGNLGGGTLVLLRKALQTGRFGFVLFTADQLREARNLLDQAISSHISGQLNSLAFLREVEAAV